jgi:hypothetical protein
MNGQPKILPPLLSGRLFGDMFKNTVRMLQPTEIGPQTDGNTAEVFILWTGEKRLL